MNPHNSNSPLEFLMFQENLASNFEEINRQWIDDMFQLEEQDLAILKNPQGKIIAPGGQIYFAKHKDQGIIGCCALMPKNKQVFELTKMGILEGARGLGAGEKLLQFVLQEAAKLPIKLLYLLTSDKCSAAIHLYRRNGFVDDAQVMQEFGSAYKRCNVAMSHCAVGNPKAHFATKDDASFNSKN